MTLPRLTGILVALIGAVLVVLAVIAYGPTGEQRVTPTGGVTAGGPQDTVPTGPAADQVLRKRAELQTWRGHVGPTYGEPTPATATQDLAAKAGGIAANKGTPSWVTAPPSNVTLYRDRSSVVGLTTLPEPRTDVLLQAAGRDWRRVMNLQITVGGGIALLAVLTLLGLFLALRGRVRVTEGFSGIPVPRFDGYERFNHWMTAISFILVALTGLILIYGQHLLRPLIGASAYSGLAIASVWIHVGFAIPFVVGVITMIVLWVRQNGFNAIDMGWLARGGGLFFKTRQKPHAYRFNAGQKLIFWLVVLFALALLVSGISLLFPFFWLQIGGMQLTLVIHAVIGLAMIALILGHIYIGTIGMEGAFPAMWSGEVDLNWAREHHDLWIPETQGRAPGPAAGD